jgi:hypothetical protein
MNNEEHSNAPVEAPKEQAETQTPVNKTNASQGQESAAEQAFSLDALLDRHLPGEEFQREKHTGIDYNKVLGELPSDAKKLIQNLREDYRKKTTKLSKRKKELEAREQSLLSSHTENQLRKAMELPEDLDLYDPEGLKTFIQAKAAEELNKLLEPARKDLTQSKRIEEVRAFEREHPDIKEYGEEIKGLIAERGLKIEEAYFLVKGRQTKSLLEKKEEELRAYKQAARDNGYKVSVGKPTSQTRPKFKSAWDVYRHLKERG